MEACGSVQASRPKVNCDQEAIVQKHISTAALMIRDLMRYGTGSNYEAVERAFQGIIDGHAVEIIRTLGMEPCFVNISQLPKRDWKALVEIKL